MTLVHCLTQAIWFDNFTRIDPSIQQELMKIVLCIKVSAVNMLLEKMHGNVHLAYLIWHYGNLLAINDEIIL